MRLSDFLLFVRMLTFLICGIPSLKIALKVTKADTRTGLKWVLASFGAQIGIIAFVTFPLIIIAVSGAKVDFGIIIPIIILAIFLWMNILNVIHKLGVKRTIAVFSLQLILILVIGGIGIIRPEFILFIIILISLYYFPQSYDNEFVLQLLEIFGINWEIIIIIIIVFIFILIMLIIVVFIIAKKMRKN